MNSSIGSLEEKFGYRFRHQELLLRALTHRSWLSERTSPIPETGDNEQLEFLGDSILGFIVSERLFLRHPSAREGSLSKWKAHLVSATHLHRCALEIGLGEYLLLGKGEDRNGGRERKTVLANALEAVIAAVHIDGGIEAVRTFIDKHVLQILDNSEDVESIDALNFKSVLQERTQALGLPAPRYVIVESSGPEHAKVFTVEVRVGDGQIGRASGTSKKSASQGAARQLLDRLAEAV
ncbi:MAG TPA: ribonuclease III [Bryobacteraceae bacterium]|jgi:ribonuclease-3|nr:ribonuclease III [Bryobacteraceae bacterium]